MRGRDAKPQERGIQSLPVCACLATKPDFSLRRLRLIVLTRYLDGGTVRPDCLQQPWKMSLRRSVQCCRQQYHNCGHVCSICLHKSHRITLLLFTHSLERFQDHNCPWRHLNAIKTVTIFLPRSTKYPRVSKWWKLLSWWEDKSISLVSSQHFTSIVKSVSTNLFHGIFLAFVRA